MTVKYKVSDFAKDLSISAKKVLDELNAMGSTGKKNSSNLEENELNYLLEKFSKDNSVANLDEFLNSAKAAKEEPKPTEKKAEKKAEKKPEAPKAERSRSSLPPKRQSLPSRIRTAISITKRRTSSTRSARKRPFLSANWLVRPVPRHPLLRHRLCPCAARTIRSPWIPALWI